VRLSLLTLLPILLVFAIFPRQIAGLYTDDMMLAAQSVPALYTIYVGVLIMTAAMVYFEFVSGTGRTLIALLMETGVLFFYILYIYMATEKLHLPIRWVWCSEWVYSILILVASLLFMRFYPWKKRQ
jgi:Na+-driven multidrug efflux pump